MIMTIITTTIIMITIKTMKTRMIIVMMIFTITTIMITIIIMLMTTTIIITTMIITTITKLIKQADVTPTYEVTPVHDDVIKWKHFPRYWPFVRGIHQSPVNSLHKGKWRVALMFSLICAWINGWVNNRDARLVIWDAIADIMTSQ